MFVSFSKKEIKKMSKTVRDIESLRDSYHALSDIELQEHTAQFKQRLEQGESLDSLLVEAFATVREASRRVLQIEHYPVQLMGGIALYHGHIAEMKTGEGKSAMAALPSYLMALTGRGVHVVTVNEYLAQRDAEEVGAIHRFLGLSVGCVLADMPQQARQEAYRCDITYITNTELGFDYLRDNMVTDVAQCVQRDLHYAIIDEIDSILIDEARTPLIISGPNDDDITIYQQVDHFVSMLQKGKSNGSLTKMDIISGTEVQESGDYVVDEKDKFVHLTASGIRKAEAFFHVKNLADPSCMDIQHYITMALKAHSLMHIDKDYIVKDGMVLIVDEFTGRIMDGRRYSDGLHQAIEAKEHVEIKQENHTLASITLQNFFNKYEVKSGMTGTAMTEEKEFHDIYHMRVVSIPTNKPVIRKDLDDIVYATKQDKYRAIVEEVKLAHSLEQPVLVGTASIDVSETLGELLRKAGIPHQILNAKYHEKEAEIIAHAGEAGMVTIATNMAGRGTDIKLDDRAKEAGGLYVIGTERHESRRIDNQLRGRSGRQGDPGKSRFFVSLEDDVLRLFIPESWLEIFRNSLQSSTGVIENKQLSKAIVRAQKKIEGNHFLSRKYLTDFDAINNEQRELIYAERREILESDSISDKVRDMLLCVTAELCSQNKERDHLCMIWQDMFADDITKLSDDCWKSESEICKSLSSRVMTLYEDKCKQFSQVDVDIMKDVERMVMVKMMDKYWMQHMTMLDTLRQNLSLVGYGQKDPVVEYRAVAYEEFDTMLKKVRYDAASLLLKAQIREANLKSDSDEQVTA